MNFELRNLFPTPLWIFNLDEEFPNLRSMVEMDGIGYSQEVNQGKLKVNDFFKFQGYGVEKLKDLTESCIEKICQDMKWEASWSKFIKRMHVRQNIIPPNDFDSPHHHPKADLIGVYYVSVPENSGDILFHDPRGSINFLWKGDCSNDDNHRGKTGRVCHRITPKEGQLIMCPAYFIHSVEANLSNKNRISIVMNIKIDFEEHD